jgi:superfamily II DNA helicase RecQ
MANGDDFEDSLFDNVDEAELAALERPMKRRHTSEGLQDSREDDVFDDLDEADLAELERPTKRLRTSAEVPNTQGHLPLAERILKEQFGYPAFRHEQAGAIQSILAGDNALVIFPTGAGKSLCYQV